MPVLSTVPTFEIAGTGRGRYCAGSLALNFESHDNSKHRTFMSMISILVFASDDEIRQLLSEPETIDEFLEQDRTSTDLDKAWHGIHWLLTGSADGGDEPLCYLLAGGDPVGDVDVGYGPARALTSHQVAAWDDALSELSIEELARRFDPKAMLDAKIYPEIWARSISGQEDTLDYLLQAYFGLRDFVAAARKERSGLLVYLS